MSFEIMWEEAEACHCGGGTVISRLEVDDWGRMAYSTKSLICNVGVSNRSERFGFSALLVRFGLIHQLHGCFCLSRHNQFPKRFASYAMGRFFLWCHGMCLQGSFFRCFHG